MSPAPQIIHGPTADNGGRLIYQVTLEHGVVLTNPSGFGEQGAAAASESDGPVFSEHGRLLAPPR
jgi:hypothetical protein